MAQPERTEDAGGDGEWTDLPPGTKPIPPEYYRRPGGCGFVGCTTIIVVFAVIALAVLVFGLLTRQWITPIVSPRG